VTEPAAAVVLEREYNKRISIEPELLDLCNILSIQKAAKRLLQRKALNGRLDVLIANAGIGGWEGVDWWGAAYQAITSPHTVLSKPQYKKTKIGAVCRPQLPATDPSETKQETEPPLGEVFTANLFGHYLLVHYLAPLISAHSEEDFVRGRVIWVSTLEAYRHTLDMNDFQGINSSLSYESSKRITDAIVLSSDFPSTQQHVAEFFQETEASPSAQAPTQTTTRPKMYLSHPGICQTGIMPISQLLMYGWLFALYLCRWLGSPWHTCRPYPGATAPVWLALAEQATLDKREGTEGKSKWGSAINWLGKERVLRTEVQGWGFGGIVGEKGPKLGLWGDERLSEETRSEFEGLGKECWARMEGLRKEWEERLEGADVVGSN
jgi:3-keto steroid reductase